MILWPAIAGIGISLVIFLFGLVDIAHSTSSTAAISLIFLPFYALVFGVIGFLNLWAVGCFIQCFQSWRTPHFWSWTRCLALLVAIVISSLTIQKTVGHFARQAQLAAAGNSSGTKLEAILSKSFEQRDFPALERVAANLSASPASMEKLFDFARGGINRPGAREYGTLHELARNPNTPPAILLALGESTSVSIGVALALNPSSPPELVPILINSPNHLVRHWSTRHRSITKADLEKLAKDTDPRVANHARRELRRNFPDAIN